MKDKLTDAAAKHHRHKALLLEREYHVRKTAGEHRIWKQQEELRAELDRIKQQIQDHLRKAGMILSGT